MNTYRPTFIYANDTIWFIIIYTFWLMKQIFRCEPVDWGYS